MGDRRQPADRKRREGDGRREVAVAKPHLRPAPPTRGPESAGGFPPKSRPYEPCTHNLGNTRHRRR